MNQFNSLVYDYFFPGTVCWVMGALYDVTPIWLIVFLVCAQLIAVPFFYFTWRSAGKRVE